MWNGTRPRHLSDIRSYNTSKDGYWSEWVDSMPYATADQPRHSSRLQGYFVAPASGDYTLYMQCDDRCALFFSNSTRPEDKVSCRERPRGDGPPPAPPPESSLTGRPVLSVEEVPREDSGGWW